MDLGSVLGLTPFKTLNSASLESNDVNKSSSRYTMSMTGCSAQSPVNPTTSRNMNESSWCCFALADPVKSGGALKPLGSVLSSSMLACGVPRLPRFEKVIDEVSEQLADLEIARCCSSSSPSITGAWLLDFGCWVAKAFHAWQPSA